MDIEEISTETIKLFIEEGLISDLPSLYDLPNKQEAILALPGFKQKSVDNIVKSINAAKNRDLDKFIFALGIRHVGSKISTLLAKRFGSIHNLMNAKQEDIDQIRDLGATVAESVVDYFKDEANIKVIESLLNKGVKLNEMEAPSSNRFAGMTFVITGSLSQPRDYFKALIEKNSGNVSNSVSSRTTYVLAGEEAGSKLDKANSLGVKVIKEEDLVKLIQGE